MALIPHTLANTTLGFNGPATRSTWKPTCWPSTFRNASRRSEPDGLRIARQTLSYLRNLFDERGIHPKNKLGQNFLIDLNLLDLLLRSAELTPDDLVLEVGSGTGSLTVRLLEQAGAWSASRSIRLSPS